MRALVVTGLTPAVSEEWELFFYMINGMNISTKTKFEIFPLVSFIRDSEVISVAIFFSLADSHCD